MQNIYMGEVVEVTKGPNSAKFPNPTPDPPCRWEVEEGSVGGTSDYDLPRKLQYGDAKLRIQVIIHVNTERTTHCTEIPVNKTGMKISSSLCSSK